MKKVTIEFLFEETEENDKFGDETFTYKNHDLVAFRRADSDLTSEEIKAVTEGLAQSDHWWVDAVNCIIPALESDGIYKI